MIVIVKPFEKNQRNLVIVIENIILDKQNYNSVK